MKTTNFEISKKLKEIGFQAEFNFHYKAPDHVNLYDSGYEDYKERNTPSYDLETLLEALPKKITYQNLPTGYKVYFTKYDTFTPKVNFCVADGQCYIGYFSNFIPVIESWQEKNESLADTAGRLLIELFEAGIINFKK